MANAPIPIASRQPGHILREALGWVWEPPESQGIRLAVDGLEYRGRELHGEVEVTLCGEHLHLATYNLSQERSRRDLITALTSKTSLPGEERMGSRWPWARLIEQFCSGVIKKEREGEALAFTTKVPARPKEYVVDYLALKGKTNLLIAPGGHGKGIVAVALTVSVAGARGVGGDNGQITVQKATPIYFDWEDQLSDYEDRVNSYCRGLGIDVPSMAYQRMHGSVPDRIHLMSRKIAESGATFGVIDSMSAAMGTTGDRGSWDTIAQRFFDALDLITAADRTPMTWFIIGHVSGEGLKGLMGKAFGSIQIMNRSRNAWEMRSTQEPGSNVVHMRLYDAKWNHTGLRKPLGFRMQWSSDSVTLNTEDPNIVNTDGGVATFADRIEALLIRGPLSVGILAIELKAPENKVRSVLSQNKDRFEKNDRGYWDLAHEDQPAMAEGPLPW